MSRIALAFIISFFSFPSHGSSTPKPDPEAILKAAENIRNPSEDYKVQITLTDENKEKKNKNDKDDVRTYETLCKGKDKALVRFLTPEVDKGTKILFVEEQMWVYLPSTAKPLRISAKQKLSGNAAYGDIARIDFVGRYHSKLLREDTYLNRKVYVLDLTAIEGKSVTYDRVEYWVDTITKSPLKAIYETEGGKVLWDCYFDKFTDIFGVKRPSRLRIVDHLQPSHSTSIFFHHFKKENLPDLLFERENFGRS